MDLKAAGFPRAAGGFEETMSFPDKGKLKIESHTCLKFSNNVQDKSRIWHMRKLWNGRE